MAKTRLNLKSLISLIEEERDFNLLMSSVANLLSEHDAKEFILLSLSLRIRLAVYYCSKDAEFDIDDKAYIIRLLVENQNFIYNGTGGVISKDKESKEFIKFINKYSKNTDIEVKIPSHFHQFQHKRIVNDIRRWLVIINNAHEMIFGVMKIT